MTALPYGHHDYMGNVSLTQVFWYLDEPFLQLFFTIQILTDMTQYIISYHCETKQKIISTLHGKKIVCICRDRGCSTGMRGGAGEMKRHCADPVKVFVKKTQSLLVKSEKESALDSFTSHLWTRDLRTEVNKNPKDDGKCQSFWKCCAFEIIIITFESAFLKL